MQHQKKYQPLFRICKWLIVLYLCSLTTSFAGQERAVPVTYSRIICMGPSLTEAVFALGGGDRVVGVSDFCVYPPEALKIARVGGVMNPNLERYTVLRPDLVIFRGAQEKVLKLCKARDIATLKTDMDTLEGIFNGIEKLGGALGFEENANQLNGGIRSQLDDVRESVKGLARPKVFICIGRTPGGLSSIFTCGNSSFITQLIDLAGGENIFSQVTQPYPEASKETLVRRAPDIILEMRPGEDISPDERRRLVSEWKALRTVPAVKNNRIFVLTEDFLLIPGPRVGMTARTLAKIIHGDDVLSRGRK